MSPQRSPIATDRARGFTLLEISVVLTLIGLLAMMALPVIRRAMLRAQVSAVANDLRIFSGAFQLQHAEKQAWPETAAPGLVPAGMASSLSAAWTKPTPFGGAYQWVASGQYRGNDFKGAILVTQSGDRPLLTNYEQLTALDRLIDDGNLLTGAMQVSSYPQFVYILE